MLGIETCRHESGGYGAHQPQAPESRQDGNGPNVRNGLLSHEVNSTPHRRAAVRWVPLAAALVVGAAATVIILSLRNAADDNRRAQLSLALFQTQMHELNSLEWHAVARRSVSAHLRDKIEAAHHAMTSELDQAIRLAPRQRELRRLSTYHDRYMMAVEEELRLLDAGRMAKAREVDENMVDPGFQRLDQATRRAVEINGKLAQERTDASERMSVLATVVALAVIGVLLRRFDRAQHASRASDIEKRALRKSEERFRSLVQNSSDVVFIVKADGILRYASTASYRIIGRQPQDMLGTNVLDQVNEDDVAEVKNFLAGCVRHPSSKPTVVFRYRHGDGRWIYVEAIGNNRLEDSAVAGIVMNCRDVSDRKELENSLRSLSLRDDLTGLHNRRGFFTLAQQQMKVAARANRELFLVFADLDGLKYVNDTLGHGAGDQMLRDVADVLRQTFRESDVISRMGGDEFAILGEQATDCPIDLLLARLQGNLDERNARQHAQCQIELSVGAVSVKATPGASIDDVLATADMRMYVAKRERRKSA